MVYFTELELGLGLDLYGLYRAGVMASESTVEVWNIHGRASDGNQLKSNTNVESADSAN